MTVQPIKCQEKQYTDIGEGYLISKMGRQVGETTAEALTSIINAVGSFRYHAGLFTLEPTSQRFEGAARYLYDPQTATARSFRRTIPNRFQPINPSSASALQKSGLKISSIASAGEVLIYGAKFGVGVAALSSCWKEGCSNKQWVSVTSDTALSGTMTAAKTLDVSGRLLYAANSVSPVATGILRSGLYATAAAGAFNFVTGITRFSIEANHYFETGEARASSAASAVSDTSLGMYQTLRSGLTIAKACGESTIAGANRVLAVTDVLFSGTKLGTALRVFGIVGAAAGLAVNGYTLGDSWTKLNEIEETEERIGESSSENEIAKQKLKKNMISSTIGIVSNVVMGVSAAMVATPLAPLSLPLFAVAGLISAGQSIYDHYDEIKARWFS